MALNIDIEKRDPQGLDRMEKRERPFSRVNYYMMGGCLALIVLGFVLMSGGGSTVENGFNPEIFSTRRIVVGPMLSFLGFLLMAFSIVWMPKKKVKSDSEETE
jgi:hypothetical protein